jgi:hypothetical protein
MDTLNHHEPEQPHVCTAAPEILSVAAEQALPVYQKCLDCDYLGRTCVGRHMSELGGTEAVRGYHRMLRAARNIHIPEIYPVAPHIGKGTINDYFGRSSTQDFKLTTVLAIDRALVAICGKRVGQPPLEGFCPADAADLRERNEALATRLNEAEIEIARLTELLRNEKASSAALLSEQREAYLGQVNSSEERRKEAEARATDYLQRVDRKNTQIDSLYNEIRQLNTEILRMASSHAEESKAMVDRVIRMAEIHEDDFRKMQFGTGRESE